MIDERNKTRGQVSIEFALAFVMTMVFFVLVVKLFGWFCGDIVSRQQKFEGSRSTSGGASVTDFASDKMNIF